MWNSWSKLDKEWNLQGWSAQKPHSLGVFYFGLGVFKGCNTLLRKLTCYDLQDLQKFQDKPNFSGVFKKAFPQPPCLFFSEQPTDNIYSAHCTSLEPFPELPENEICYLLHPKYTYFSCFPIICTSAVWKSLF